MLGGKRVTLYYTIDFDFCLIFFLVIGSINQQAFCFERVSEQTDTGLDQGLQIE